MQNRRNRPVRRDPWQQDTQSSFISGQDSLGLAPLICLDIISYAPKIILELVIALRRNNVPILPQNGATAIIKIPPVRRPCWIGLKLVFLRQLRRAYYFLTLNVITDQGGIKIYYVPDLYAAGMKELAHFVYRIYSQSTAWMPGSIAPLCTNLMDSAISGQECVTTVCCTTQADRHRSGALPTKL